MKELKDIINLDSREEIHAEAISRDMIEYLNMLLKLQRSGFQCNKEIGMALKVLHKSMGFIDKKETKNVSNKIEELSNKFQDGLKQGKLVIVNKHDRGLGKTTMLVHYALASNAIIVTNGIEQVKYVKSLNKNVKVITSTELIKGRGLVQFQNKKYLIDCGVPMEDILKIRKMHHEIIGGFHQNDLLM